MKKLITLCILVLVIAESPATAFLAELVDLGTSAGETGYTIIDWGPVQPTTSGGNWGSLATDIQSCDNFCRTVWSTENANWASITFDDKILAVEIRHLDRTADDSFKVEVDGSL